MARIYQAWKAEQPCRHQVTNHNPWTGETRCMQCREDLSKRPQWFEDWLKEQQMNNTTQLAAIRAAFERLQSAPGPDPNLDNRYCDGWQDAFDSCLQTVLSILAPVNNNG